MIRSLRVGADVLLRVAEICLENPRVERAEVRVEKPSALRFARSVGVEVTRGRE